MRDDKGGLIREVQRGAVTDTQIFEERFPLVGLAAYPFYFCAHFLSEVTERAAVALDKYRKP